MASNPHRRTDAGRCPGGRGQTFTGDAGEIIKEHGDILIDQGA
ncbi:hypothetical protein AFE_0811 [Acidithiobacillus ferrooxidans ATCC 23270]|uniref:Uncharacterized protein n=1 Tax=Acidithiobacillus ferrooxidans (strain ATCC 23270 / DSM 14882 / CIP 104768 / NCIMB 8455) TaxID=243159 RepID=B7J6M7_ACIF2|nr:hypothetical protein AFE_0811 [Acidithiobacillus ferrooxidans ATCC 23270]